MQVIYVKSDPRKQVGGGRESKTEEKKVTSVEPSRWSLRLSCYRPQSKAFAADSLPIGQSLRLLPFQLHLPDAPFYLGESSRQRLRLHLS